MGQKIKIVFFGDSITDMGRYRETEVGSVWNLGAGYPFIVASEISKGDPYLLSILVGINDVGHDINKQDGVEIDSFQRVYNIKFKNKRRKTKCLT